MKVYLLSKYNFENFVQINSKTIIEILKEIAGKTNTENLVVAIYFLRHCRWTGGTAYVRKWMSSAEFNTNRGRWKISKDFPPPYDLPEKFKLIRLLFDLNLHKYPLKQNDYYDWIFHYSSFQDHLALIFAHELHHFRRFHLGLHKGEGEQSANRWALSYVKELKFNVTGYKITKNKKKNKFKKFIYKKLDPYKEYRHLSVGTKLLIKYDPKEKYKGEIVSVLRPIRSNSKRIVIETSDGKLWRWPMEWLGVSLV